MKAVALNLMRFFEDESCGQCTPCRVGTEKAVKLDGSRGRGTRRCSTELSTAMRDASICGLGQAAPNPLTSVIKYFRDDLTKPMGKMADAMNRSRSKFDPRRPARSRPQRRRDHLAGREAPRHGHPASVLLAGARLSRRRQLPRLHGRDRRRARARRVVHPHAGARHEGEDATAPRRDRAQDGVRAAGRRSAGARRRRTIRTRSSGTGPIAWASPDSRFPARDEQPAPDRSHAAMAVNLDACIHCNLCVRACREVQVNDVIGMAGRGHNEKIVFDFDDPMGKSTCVACGECVQACPTGALMPSTMVDANNVAPRQARPHGGLACARIAASAASSPIRSRTTRSSRSTARTARPTRTACA